MAEYRGQHHEGEQRHAKDQGFNSIGIAVPKGKSDRLAALCEFVEAAKASGLVQQAIDRSGWHGIRVVPPGGATALASEQ